MLWDWPYENILLWKFEVNAKPVAGPFAQRFSLCPATGVAVVRCEAKRHACNSSLIV